MTAAIAQPAVSADSSIHVLKLEVSNFKKIKALKINCEGNHVEISGRNNRGKSSVLDAIWAIFRGIGKHLYPEVIHDGAERCMIHCDCGAFVATRYITPKSSRIEVTTADGSVITKKQEFLDAILGQVSFNLSEFLEAKPREQLDMLLAVAGVQPPVEQVREITGELHVAKPGESADAYLQRLCGDDTGHFYLERRQCHRDVIQKEAALQESRQSLEALGGPIKGEQEAQPSEIVAKIQQLQAKQDQRNEVIDTAADSQKKLEGYQAKLNVLETDRQKSLDERRRVDEQIKALQARVADIDAQTAALDGRIANGKAIVAEATEQATADNEAVLQLPDPAPAIDELRRQLNGIEAANKTLMKRRLGMESVQKLGKDKEAATAEHEKRERWIRELRELKAHQLDGVNIGIEGVTIGDGEIRFNGKALSMAGDAESAKLACAVAVLQKPALKILRIDRGERFDDISKDYIYRFASARGWQVWMACVASGDELKVEIVEGE